MAPVPQAHGPPLNAHGKAIVHLGKLDCLHAACSAFPKSTLHKRSCYFRKRGVAHIKQNLSPDAKENIRRSGPYAAYRPHKNKENGIHA